MSAPYCTLCDEHLAPEQTTCPACDEPAVDYDAYCEAAWERRQEDLMSGGGPLSPDEQHRLAWLQKQELRR